MSSTKSSSPQSDIPSVAFVTALNIFVTLIDWEELLYGYNMKGSTFTVQWRDKQGKKKEESYINVKSRRKHRGVYFQNLNIFQDMKPDRFWHVRKHDMIIRLEQLVRFKTFSSPEARTRYIEKDFYYAMISYGPFASPRWYDWFLLYRSTPEWTHLVNHLVKAIKQLSLKECRWLLYILKMPWLCLDDKDKLPKSFLNDSIFYECVKKCMVDSRDEHSRCKTMIRLGQVKDVESYFEAEIGRYFSDNI